jgi:hypothetical protein
MGQTRNPSRPTLTGDLVQRLESHDTSPEEATSLQALSKEMIKVFKDDPKPSYLREATALASVVTAKDYADLFQWVVDGIKRKDHLEFLAGLKTVTKVFMTFLNAIIVAGNSKSNNKNRNLLEQFKTVVKTIQDAGHSSSSQQATVVSFHNTMNAIKSINPDPTLVMGLVFALNHAKGGK